MQNLTLVTVISPQAPVPPLNSNAAEHHSISCRTNKSMPPTILFLVTEDHSFWSRRLATARMLRDSGAEVWVMTRLQHLQRNIEHQGFKIISWKVSRKSLNPFLEIRAFLQTVRAYKRIRPNLVHHFSLKASVYGGIAAWLCGSIPSVSTIPGLGHVFTNKSAKMRVLRRFVLFLLRLTHRRANAKVVFQNSDNLELFIEERVVERQHCVLIRGSGVDCKQFSPEPEPSGIPVVLFAGRMLWEKGLAEFIAAIQILRGINISARFVLVGQPDLAHRSSISESQLREWVAAGHVEWWGHRDDMAQVFAQSNLVCLPSYGEGVPKCLIEAAACGRALVASDVPGCREIVHHGENGLLVSVHDAASLAGSIAALLANPSLRAQMGARGRAIAIKDFSEELVLSQTLALYQQLLRNAPGGQLSLLEPKAS